MGMRTSGGATLCAWTPYGIRKAKDHQNIIIFTRLRTRSASDIAIVVAFRRCRSAAFWRCLDMSNDVCRAALILKDATVMPER